MTAMGETERPEITFIPLSTDEGKIRFFGTLMPALLLLKAAPGQFFRHQIAGRIAPRTEIGSFVTAATDDYAQVDGTLIFVHRWESDQFDPLAFARARTFLAQITRLLRREGYRAEPLDPLSPRENLPKLAARAGLGTLSPYGLLVHPTFGPRLILTGLRTDGPVVVQSRREANGCTDCMSCVEVCPQQPRQTGTIRLGECQSCAQCLVVCPVGKR